GTSLHCLYHDVHLAIFELILLMPAFTELKSEKSTGRSVEPFGHPKRKYAESFVVIYLLGSMVKEACKQLSFLTAIAFISGIINDKNSGRLLLLTHYLCWLS